MGLGTPMAILERFSQFVMDYWLGVIVACAVVAVVCIARRRSPWIIGLWLPSFAVASIYSLSVIIASLLEQGQGELTEAWAGVRFLVALPLILLAMLLLFVRPPSSAWRSRAAVVGYVLAGALPLAALLATRIPPRS